ncbi:MAG TPA: YceI family protein [Oligoflexia bacterium]|nr:YceI family protein [Oligoflexia bacterium]
MKLASVFLAFLALTSLSASAAGEPVKMEINTSESKVEWFASKVKGKHNGTIEVESGEFELDGKGMIKSGKIEIDMDSIKVSDIEDAEDNAKLAGHLKSDDFFNAEKWPTATFVIKTALPLGKRNSDGWQKYTLKGDLTIRDVTKPFTAHANVKIAGEAAEATAELNIDRTQWNVKYGSGKFFKGLADRMIHDVFKLKIALKAEKD